jgi:hypothetical protein
MHGAVHRMHPVTQNDCNTKKYYLLTKYFFVLKRYAQEVNFNFAGMGGGISKGQCIFLISTL